MEKKCFGIGNLIARARVKPLLSSVAFGCVFAVAGAVNAQTASSNGGIEEIVVTAEKVTSTVQSTPATIEVVSPETLARQNIVQLDDLQDVLVDTQFVDILGTTQVVIRGIGNNFVDPRADSAVAISVNGLFYDRPLPADFGFLDVSRVENLEGPQGTLYGRNSVAGALNIVTNQPTQDFGGYLTASVGNLGAYNLTGVVNIPVTDTLAVRFAYNHDFRDGYVGHYYNDIDNDIGRFSARWTPTSHLTIYAETNYMQLGGHGDHTTSYPCVSSPWSLVDTPACLPSPIFASGVAAKTGRQHSHITSDLLHVDYDFGWATLTSISGVVGTHYAIDQSPNGTAFKNTIRENDTDYSEEVRLAGNSDASHAGGLAWQVGGYFFSSHGDYSQIVHTPGTSLPPTNLPPSAIQKDTAVPQRSQAGYGQVTYGLTDDLRITGGLRYTTDYKGLSYYSDSYLPPFCDTCLRPPSTGKTNASGSKVTYKAGLEYDVAPEHLLYASYSTGYAAGGVDGGNASVPVTPGVQPSAFEPETITAYEVGSKNRFFNDTLQLNGDFYYYDFKNYQYIYPSLVQGGGSISGIQVENVAGAKAYGGELSAVYNLTDSDQLSASVAYSHATFSAIDLNFYPPPFGPAEVIHVPSGSQVPNDPEWAALVGYEHTWNLDQGSNLTFSVNSKISGKYLVVIGSSDPDDTQKAYTKTDASLAYHWSDDKYVVRAWVKNIENSAVNVYGQGQTFHLYTMEPPRTYGLTATANF